MLVKILAIIGCIFAMSALWAQGGDMPPAKDSSEVVREEKRSVADLMAKFAKGGSSLPKSGSPGAMEQRGDTRPKESAVSGPRSSAVAEMGKKLGAAQTGFGRPVFRPDMPSGQRNIESGTGKGEGLGAGGISGSKVSSEEQVSVVDLKSRLAGKLPFGAKGQMPAPRVAASVPSTETAVTPPIASSSSVPAVVPASGDVSSFPPGDVFLGKVRQITPDVGYTQMVENFRNTLKGLPQGANVHALDGFVAPNINTLLVHVRRYKDALSPAMKASVEVVSKDALRTRVQALTQQIDYPVNLVDKNYNNAKELLGAIDQQLSCSWTASSGQDAFEIWMWASVILEELGTAWAIDASELKNWQIAFLEKFVEGINTAGGCYEGFRNRGFQHLVELLTNLQVRLRN